MTKLNDKKTVALKYRLQEKLDSLPYIERMAANKLIPLILKTSRQSFYFWRKIEKDSPKEIPYSKLQGLARFFECNIEDLAPIDCNTPTLKQSMHLLDAPKNKVKSSLVR